MRTIMPRCRRSAITALVGVSLLALTACGAQTAPTEPATGDVGNWVKVADLPDTNGVLKVCDGTTAVYITRTQQTPATGVAAVANSPECTQ